MSTSVDIVRTNKNLVFFKCQQDPLQSFRKSAMAQTSKYFKLLWSVVCEVRTSPWWLSSALLSILLWDKFALEHLPFPEANSFGPVTRRMTSLALIEGDILPLCVSEGGYSLSSRRNQCLYEGDISSFARFQGKPSLFSRRNKCLKCALASTFEAAMLRPWGL